jgi:UTP--glucose-1-phosphate uridylyltransferase
MKAVIPVAGLGTRMLPATKAIPKEMLPIVDKPLIQYVVNEAISAGIKDIIFVTHASKNSIENHFDTSFELETQLERRVKRQLLAEVQSIVPRGVTISSVRQSHPKGLGHAISCARGLIGDNPFVVLLPDVLINEYCCDLKKDNLADMLQLFKQTQVGQIMVEGVDADLVDQYGIADIGQVIIEPGLSVKINGLIEKPSIDGSPSNLAIVGRYVLPKEIWPLLLKTPAGSGDEIQLTDAIIMLMKDFDMNAYCIKGQSHDCGSKFGYMKTNLEYALRHSEIGELMKEHLRKNIPTL